ncbi:hypothetical protein A6V29_03520 [Blastococcus sp. CCUG 61487]|nr:hypothetical protein A6V29_03520 [Blastococcus sp. CCUG 61487]
MPAPHLRAADAVRAALAAVLGEHMAAGRLTVAEYEERLARAYAATTYGELGELTADLPRGAPPEQPARRAHSRAARHGWGCHGADAGAWRSWASTAAIVLTIWALTSLASAQLLYFWPMWVIGPWGALLLAQSRGGRGRSRPLGRSAM